MTGVRTRDNFSQTTMYNMYVYISRPLYILGTHYRKNQCLTLVYSRQLFITLRPHFIPSYFKLGADTKYMNTDKNTQINTVSVHSGQVIILMSMI